MTATQIYTATLNVTECPRCHMDFGITPQFEQPRRDDHTRFYCPAGHSMSYGGKSEAEKLRDALDIAQRQAKSARTSRDAAWDQAHAAERSASAYKGHVTRLRNRIANGVCPVAGCRRHFDNVQAHIQGEHPDWAAEHAEVLS